MAENYFGRPQGANANPYQAYVSDADIEDEDLSPFNRSAPASRGNAASRPMGNDNASTNPTSGIPGRFESPFRWPQRQDDQFTHMAERWNHGSSPAPSATSTVPPSCTSERPPVYLPSALGSPQPGGSAQPQSDPRAANYPQRAGYFQTHVSNRAAQQNHGQAQQGRQEPQGAGGSPNTPASYQYPPEMRTYLDAQIAAQEARGGAPGGPFGPAPPPRSTTASQGPPSVGFSDTSDSAASRDVSMGSPAASMGSPVAPNPPQAPPTADSNVNSTNCFNCDVCVGCKDSKHCSGCVNCTRCQHCKGCVNCTDCRDCINCVNCHGCDGLVGKVGVREDERF